MGYMRTPLGACWWLGPEGPPRISLLEACLGTAPGPAAAEAKATGEPRASLALLAVLEAPGGAARALVRRLLLELAPSRLGTAGACLVRELLRGSAPLQAEVREYVASHSGSGSPAAEGPGWSAEVWEALIRELGQLLPAPQRPPAPLPRGLPLHRLVSALRDDVAELSRARYAEARGLPVQRRAPLQLDRQAPAPVGTPVPPAPPASDDGSRSPRDEEPQPLEVATARGRGAGLRAHLAARLAARLQALARLCARRRGAPGSPRAAARAPQLQRLSPLPDPEPAPSAPPAALATAPKQVCSELPTQASAPCKARFGGA